jgi:hypothetical protein
MLIQSAVRLDDTITAAARRGCIYWLVGAICERNEFRKEKERYTLSKHILSSSEIIMGVVFSITL